MTFHLKRRENVLLSEEVARLRAERDAALAQVERLRAALLGVSPWNLQDCWCQESDRGEKNDANQHRPECRAARAALKGNK